MKVKVKVEKKNPQKLVRVAKTVINLTLHLFAIFFYLKNIICCLEKKYNGSEKERKTFLVFTSEILSSES